MKIIVASRDLDYGAGSVVKIELKEFDKNKKIKKIIVIGPKKLEGFGNKVKFEIIPNIGRFFITKEFFFAFLCDKKIRSILSSEKIDKIYLHFPIFSNNYNTKLIIKFHRLHKTKQKLPYLDMRLIIANIFHQIYSYFDYRTIKHANKVLFVSKRTLEEAKSFYSDYKDKFEYTPNTIDKSKFFKLSKREKDKLKKEMGIDDGKKNLLYVGRLEPMKGILDLINIINQINNINIRLIVIGDGPLKKKINKHSFIKYIGRVSNEELYKYYNIADLFILPSYYENMPLTILEAKECGCKILSRDVGDVRYILNKNSIFYTSKELKKRIDEVKNE